MNPGPIRRYQPQTPRRCARAGCGAPAAATLRFQPTRRVAALVDLDGDGTRTEGDLCLVHAAAVALPRGFELMDRRSGVRDEVALDRIADPLPVVAPVAVLEPEPEFEPEAEVAIDDLAQILDASTPMLRRAFGNIQLD